jgi:hypothetical protein
MAVETQRGDIPNAVSRARAMLDDRQQRLPDSFGEELARAAAAWDDDRPDDAADHLGRAIVAGRVSGHT